MEKLLPLPDLPELRVIIRGLLQLVRLRHKHGGTKRSRRKQLVVACMRACIPTDITLSQVFRGCPAVAGVVRGTPERFGGRRRRPTNSPPK